MHPTRSLPLALLVLLPLPASAADLNEGVVTFCQKNVGNKVGRGECASLVVEAYKEVGAKPWHKFDTKPGKDDYVWGTLIFTVEVKDGTLTTAKAPDYPVRPGDVIQFRDATFKTRKGRTIYTTTMPHHTAVVTEVSKDRKTVRILHQNIGGVRAVQADELRLTDLKKGWLRFYRPVPE